MRKSIFMFFVIFPFIIFALNRAKDIPGVDPLPIAIDSTQPQEKKETLTQTTLKQDTTKPSQDKPTSEHPDFPQIRNLQVIPDSTYPYSAKITWDAVSQISTPIYIVRYSRPISTKEILLNSYNLTSPPLSPDTRVFIDIDIPEGVYYYAAVTSYELSRDGVLVLKPGINHTITPFIVYRSGNNQPSNTNTTTPEKDQNLSTDRSNLKPEDFEISELDALNTEKGVVLNWKPVEISDIKYKIYRSKEPLDSKERIEKAQYLGESLKPNFIDMNPLPEEAVFYGVSVYDMQTKKEYMNLKFRKSYISHTFKKPTLDYQYLEYLPSSLIAYQVNKNTIQLFWVDAGPSVKFYKIYRNDHPISSDVILSKSKYLGNAQSGSVGFLDENLKLGRYFYAVIPVIPNNNELRVFYSNKTFTTYGIIIHGDAEQPKQEKQEDKKVTQTVSEGSISGIKNISIRLENKNNVRITWDYIPDYANRIRVLIYRSPKKISEYEDLKENSTYIGEFPLVAGVYVDRNLEAGKYYYNFVEYNIQTNEITAFYYLKNPVEIKKEDKNVIINDLDSKEPSNEIKQEKQETKQTTEQPKEITSQPQQKKETIDIDKEINKVVDLIYKQKDYYNAERKIKELLVNSDLKPNQRGKIKFEYGYLLYKLNRFKEAKRYFIDNDVLQYDSERASFWYKRIIERE
jgi:hypothetical protein